MNNTDWDPRHPHPVPDGHCYPTFEQVKELRQGLVEVKVLVDVLMEQIARSRDENKTREEMQAFNRQMGVMEEHFSKLIENYSKEYAWE